MLVSKYMKEAFTYLIYYRPNQRNDVRQGEEVTKPKILFYRKLRNISEIFFAARD